MINISLSFVMFRENNQEFLVSFKRSSSSSDSDSLRPKAMTPSPRIFNSKPKVAMYQQNDHFSWGDQSPENESQSNKKEKEKSSVQNDLGSSTRINHLKVSQALSRTRKFSSAGLNSQLINILNEEKQLAKSEKSFNCQDSMIGEEERPQHEEVQEKVFQDSDMSITIAKKMRNLQTRIKNLALKHQNDLLKVREQNSKNVSKLSVYQKYLQQHHPSILEQLQIKAQEAEENHDGFDFMSDSSASDFKSKIQPSKDNSLTMPVFSQLEEVRLYAMKLCDRLKSTSNTLQNLQQQIFTTKTSQQKKDPNVSKMLRKWSIPYLYNRQKKQSFQTTINSADFKEQRKSRKSSNMTNELKKYQYLNSQPMIKELQNGELMNSQENPNPKYTSERFIHVQNYEMDKQAEHVVCETKVRNNCGHCKQLRQFVVKFNEKLKSVTKLTKNNSVGNLFNATKIQ